VERLPSDNGIARCRVFPRDGRPIVSDLSQHIRSRQWEIDELHVEEGRLNDVFRAMTTGDDTGMLREESA
jgi:ABC-2 type transport system ATP-binding protein